MILRHFNIKQLATTYLVYHGNDDLIIDKIKENMDKCLHSKRFIERHVMSCVYETSTHIDKESDFQIFNAIKKALKKELDCYILEDEANKLAHKIPVLEKYNAASGKGVPILVNYFKKSASISEESILLQSLIKPINIKRIYVDKDFAERARKIVTEFLRNEEEE